MCAEPFARRNRISSNAGDRIKTHLIATSKSDAVKVRIFCGMDTTKQLYRELAKAYHPDKSTNQAEYDIFGQLMVAINEAAAIGDVSALEQIKALGPAYLAVKMYSESEFSGVAYPDAADTYGRPRNGSLVLRLAAKIGAILRFFHPYALLFMLDQWASIGAVRKIAALGGAVGWTFLFFEGWELLDRVSVFCANAGYPHESWVGLLIVLLRGGIILAALPCIFSLVVVGFIGAMILGIALLTCSLAAGILRIIHPLLAGVPFIILVPLTIWVLWRIFGKNDG